MRMARIPLLIFLSCLLIIGTSSNAFPKNWCDDANAQACWLMTSNGGDESDISGNDETLTETGGTIPTSSDVPTTASSSTSRVFAVGDTEYLYHADGGSTDINGNPPPGGGLSIVLWLKLTSQQAAGGLVVKYRAGNEHRQYQLLDISGQSLGVGGNFSSDGSTNTAFRGATVLDTATWYHVAVVYDDIDIRLYILGNLDSNDALNPAAYTTGIYDGQSILTVGSGNEGANRFLDGQLCDVAMFDKALDSTDLNDILDNGLVQAAAARRIWLIS